MRGRASRALMAMGVAVLLCGGSALAGGEVVIDLGQDERQEVRRAPSVGNRVSLADDVVEIGIEVPLTPRRELKVLTIGNVVLIWYNDWASRILKRLSIFEG